uniref:Na_H_Exchanger domain-containing protein n=1 Tax=Strongyloides stercoralis TaxID=6248 RepID=A0A0K0EHU9_STRER
MKYALEELFLAFFGFLSLVFLLKKNLWHIIDDNEITNSIISFYILWISGLYSSRLVSIFKLPPLLGSLLSGILLRNLPIYELIIVENKELLNLFYDIGLIIILIRSGITLDIKALKKYFPLCLLIGFVSITFDIISTIGICYKLLQFSFYISFLYSLILSCFSPSIILPIIISLKKEKVYESKEITTIILTSASIMNMFCITIFTIFVSIYFENVSSYVEMQKLLLFGILFGITSGYGLNFIMVKIFKNDKENSCFKNCITLTVYCLLMFFGSKYYKNNIIGSVGIITFIINYMFNKKNKQDSCNEDDIFQYGWNNFIEPILFSTMGTTLIIKQITFDVIFIALLITIISTIAKLVGLILIHKCTYLNCKEIIYIGFSFTSKATVQATLTSILALLIIQKNFFIEGQSNYFIDKTITTITIISIITSIPLGYTLMTFFSYFIFKKELQSTKILNDNSEIEKNSIH